ncbi:Unspecific monooxygenase [Trichostrongylus colubriformis]|uniref:Unspecific monooxygenase n=1 Tax=Trichostrongylus colubriformis TaxID=6319 RepID=A0AAN8IRG3_TRICO
MKRCVGVAASSVTSTSSCPITASTAEIRQASKPRSFEEIPGPDVSARLFGRDRSLFRSKRSIANYFEWLVDLHTRYGSIVRVEQGFGRGAVVHVFDPEDARQVFASDGRQPFIVPLQETTQRYREMKGMNPGLGNLNGDEWYRLRSSVQQAMMRPQAVQKYLPYTNEVAGALVKHIRKESKKSTSGEVDVRKIAGRWALESSALTVFEKRLGALDDRIQWADELVNLNKSIFQLSAKLKFALPLYRYFPTPKWKKMVELEDKFYREADLLIDQAIGKLHGSTQSEDEMKFASLLINRKELTVKDVKVILLSMFSDGLSTTAPMLVYNLYNIATCPDIQSELRDEVNTAVRDKEITPAVLSKLPFLRACIKETFRLYPIGTEISRIPQKDLVLSGYYVPAGTPIDINTNVLMRSPELFPDPLKFQPSRWLRDSPRQQDFHPFAFLPFGFGPRMCAGRRFAEQDLQVVLCRLLQHYRIVHQHEPIKQTYETLLLPKGSCDFKFEPL